MYGHVRYANQLHWKTRIEYMSRDWAGRIAIMNEMNYSVAVMLKQLFLFHAVRALPNNGDSPRELSSLMGMDMNMDLILVR